MTQSLFDQVVAAAMIDRIVHHAEDKLDAVALTPNRRPRKTLDWATPAEAMDRLLSQSQSNGVATTP